MDKGSKVPSKKNEPSRCLPLPTVARMNTTDLQSNMKSRIRSFLQLPLILLAGTTLAAAPQPRTDVNPALLYWQAFSTLPDYKTGDGQYLGPDWAKGTPDAGAADVAGRYDGTSKILRRAAATKAPCDWGNDLSDGPATVLPNVAKIRRVAQAMALRTRVALDEGREAEAKNDLIALLYLGRRSAIDGALVQVMIGMSVEDMIVSFTAGHLHEFTSATLRGLSTAFDEGPRRITVADAVRVERVAFYGWMLDQVEAFRAAHPGDDAKVLEDFRELMRRNIDGGNDATANRIIDASGATAAGLLSYIKQVAPVYDAMGKVTTAPHDQLDQSIEEFAAMKESNTNLLVRYLIPNITRARSKELESIARLAMLKAAIAYKTGGDDAFRQIRDPFGDGPFERSGTADDGFELRSKLAAQNTKASMDFSK